MHSLITISRYNLLPPFPDSMSILCLTAFIRKSIISWSGSTPPVNYITRNTNMYFSRAPGTGRAPYLIQIDNLSISKSLVVTVRLSVCPYVHPYAKPNIIKNKIVTTLPLVNLWYSILLGIHVNNFCNLGEIGYACWV